MAFMGCALSLLVFHLDGPSSGCCSHVVTFRLWHTKSIPNSGLLLCSSFCLQCSSSRSLHRHFLLCCDSLSHYPVLFFMVLISTWHYSFFLWSVSASRAGSHRLVLPIPSRFSVYNCLVFLFSGVLYKLSTDCLIQAVQNILLFFLFFYFFNEFSIYFKQKEHCYERYYSNLFSILFFLNVKFPFIKIYKLKHIIIQFHVFVFIASVLDW